jgi:hypothetical protein
LEGRNADQDAQYGAECKWAMRCRGESMREVLLVRGLGAEHAAHNGYPKDITELSRRAGHRGG